MSEATARAGKPVNAGGRDVYLFAHYAMVLRRLSSGRPAGELVAVAPWRALGVRVLDDFIGKPYLSLVGERLGVARSHENHKSVVRG